MSLFGLLNNREKALLVWIITSVVLILLNRKTRNSLLQVVKAFFHPQILRPFAIVIFYLAFIVYLLHTTELWNATLIKDVVYWFLFTAFVLFINLNKTISDEDYFRKLVFDTLKFYVVIEYVINYFVFGFWVEFFLVPSFLLMGIMRIIAERKKEFSVIKRLINLGLAAFGVFLIVYILGNLLNNFQELATIENFQAFLLPLLLTLAYIPLLYILGLFMAYQDLFVRFNVLLNKKDLNFLNLQRGRF